MKLLLANQAVAAKRRVFFFVVDATDGITPETAEATGQPEISVDGGAWTTSGIGTLVSQGNGFYYAELTQGAVATVGQVITSHYKSAATAEAPGTTIQVVAFDPDNVASLGLTNLDGTISSVASAVASIGSGTGAALNFAALADNVLGAIEGVTFVGTQSSGTFASTTAEDGTRHVIVDSGGTPDLDIVYQFNVGAGRNAAKATWKGIVTNADTVTFQAWNGSTWDTRSTYTGSGGTANVTREIALLATHTGIGANAGRVLIRLVCSGQSAITVSTDELLVSGVSVGQTVGYAGGAIWINTLSGVAGTTPFINGTADNPCATFADALTLSALLSIKHFEITNGSTIVLTQSAANMTFCGTSWTLVLGGQAIDHASFKGAEVSGIATCTTQAEFVNCHINASTTTGPSHFVLCGFAGTVGSPFVAGSPGEFAFIDCFSEVAGTGAPYFVLSGAGGFNFRRWSGGSNITLNNASAVLTMEVVTGGEQTAACAGASVEVRGICRAVTLSGIASTSTCQINAVTGPVTLSGVDGIVRVYGVSGSVTDNRSGTPTLVNLSVSQAMVANLNVASVSGAVGSVTGLNPALLDVAVSSVAAPSAAVVADAVWDELLSGHVVAGSAGEALSSAGAAAGHGAELLTVTVRDASAALLPGASVYVHNQAGALVGHGASSAQGVVVLAPGVGVHVLTVHYTGLVFAAASVTVAEGVNSTATIAGTIATIPAGSSPARCAVYARLELANGLPAVGVIGKAHLRSIPQKLSDVFVADTSITATSIGDGLISFDLPRGASCVITIPNHITRTFVEVPDAASYELLGTSTI